MSGIINRRKPPEVPIGVASSNYNLQVGGRLVEFLRWASAFAFSIPGGFKSTAPNTVLVGGTPDPGTEDASWMAANAQLAAETGQPAGLANANVEGTSTKAPRLDHQHKRDVRVEAGGSDVGTRNALNFSADFTVADNPGGDRVDVALNPAGPAMVFSMFLARRTG